MRCDAADVVANSCYAANGGTLFTTTCPGPKELSDEHTYAFPQPDGDWGSGIVCSNL